MRDTNSPNERDFLIRWSQLRKLVEKHYPDSGIMEIVGYNPKAAECLAGILYHAGRLDSSHKGVTMSLEEVRNKKNNSQ